VPLTAAEKRTDRRGLKTAAQREKAREKRNVFSLDLNTVTESLSMTVFGSEFQTAGAEKCRRQQLKTVPEAACGQRLSVGQSVQYVLNVVAELLRLTVLLTLVRLLHVAYHRVQLQPATVWIQVR